MALELIYTSAPRGLRPGSKGFCTVAMSTGMAAELVTRLESLSGYRTVYPPESADAARNPVSWAHWQVTTASRVWHVLSRVGFAGFDYSQRSNKLGHHIVLERSELPAGGPAWLMTQPGVFESAWTGEPRLLTVPRELPAAQRPPGLCKLWRDMTGDAGWGAVPANNFLNNPRLPVVVVYQPGQPVLELLEESLALLPPEQRWQVTFNTYFTELPIGLTCAWRCVIAGSDAAEAATTSRNAGVIDLTGALGAAPEGLLTEAARTGRHVAIPTANAGEIRLRPPEWATAASAVSGGDFGGDGDIPLVLDAPDGPEEVSRFPFENGRTGRTERPRRGGVPLWAVVVMLLLALGIGVAGGVYLPGILFMKKPPVVGGAGGPRQHGPAKTAAKRQPVKPAPPHAPNQPHTALAKTKSDEAAIRALNKKLAAARKTARALGARLAAAHGDIRRLQAAVATLKKMKNRPALTQATPAAHWLVIPPPTNGNTSRWFDIGKTTTIPMDLSGAKFLRPLGAPPPTFQVSAKHGILQLQRWGKNASGIERAHWVTVGAFRQGKNHFYWQWKLNRQPWVILQYCSIALPKQPGIGRRFLRFAAPSPTGLKDDDISENRRSTRSLAYPCTLTVERQPQPPPARGWRVAVQMKRTGGRISWMKDGGPKFHATLLFRPGKLVVTSKLHRIIRAFRKEVAKAKRGAKTAKARPGIVQGILTNVSRLSHAHRAHFRKFRTELGKVLRSTKNENKLLTSLLNLESIKGAPPVTVDLFCKGSGAPYAKLTLVCSK